LKFPGRELENYSSRRPFKDGEADCLEVFSQNKLYLVLHE
jgi:hypothetical protein